jgi:hypothetical protein
VRSKRLPKPKGVNFLRILVARKRFAKSEGGVSMLRIFKSRRRILQNDSQFGLKKGMDKRALF